MMMMIMWYSVWCYDVMIYDVCYDVVMSLGSFCLRSFLCCELWGLLELPCPVGEHTKKEEKGRKGTKERKRGKKQTNKQTKQ